MMNEIYLYFRLFYQTELHQIRIDENYLIESFIEQVKEDWNIQSSSHIILYSIDQKGVLNPKKTWSENGVIDGDAILLILYAT